MRVTFAQAAKAARNHAPPQAGGDAAMIHLLRRFDAAVRLLETFPEAGRAGRRAGTRELVVGGTPYVLIYEIQQRRISILDIRDSRRRK